MFFLVSKLMPVIQNTLEYGYSIIESIPLASKILGNNYVHSGVDLVVQLGKPVVEMIDKKLDQVIGRAREVRRNVMSKYNHSKDEVILKAKDSVRQAPEMVRSISNKAASLTKQGLEISIGHDKTETVLNTVRTHTPKFVTQLLFEPPLPEAIPAPISAH